MAITDLASFFFQQIREAEQEGSRVYEPMIGVVTDNKDPEKLMRVKVKLPALGMQDTTYWVPMVSLGAGKDRGWFFLPEVDDEVLVAFEHGDLDRPIVIGALWNGKDKPPKDQPSGNPIRTLVSRAGAVVELDDDAGKVTIKDGGGKGEWVIDSKANKMTIKAATGDVAFDAATGDLQIECAEADLKGSVKFDVRGNGVNLSAASEVKLEGSGMLSVFGASTDINPGGTPSAGAASTSPEETPDPVGS
jgi:phage baseplate assembly protein V